jgi:hypothetical protein
MVKTICFDLDKVICKTDKNNDIKNANIFANYYLRIFLGKNIDKK